MDSTIIHTKVVKPFRKVRTWLRRLIDPNEDFALYELNELRSDLSLLTKLLHDEKPITRTDLPATKKMLYLFLDYHFVVR